MWHRTVAFACFLTVIGLVPGITSKSSKQPNIIFMLADDFGWNDVGFHNQDIKTPVLDQLAGDGVILNQSYVQNMCTPSRAALMTGYYPFKTGLQELVIPGFSTTGLPLKFELLPKKLKQLGYQTHMVGKWHLGACSPEYDPTKRGFDSFFGYNSGGEYYSDHSNPFFNSAEAEAKDGVAVYDFFNQTDVAWSYRGTYSSVPFLKQVDNILSKHNPEKPLFLYLPFQLTHSPLEPPAKKLRLYRKISNEARRNFSAMASQLDEDVGSIVNSLKQYDLYNNSIIFFTGDNGGEIKAGGNNFPLKGAKHTYYEGGHRATAFIHSPKLKKFGYTYNGLIHLVDYYPTIVKLGGGKPDRNKDGYDVWTAITENRTSPRKEIVYHLEKAESTISGAIRIGDWKLIIGKAGLPNTAVPPSEVLGVYKNVPGGNVFFEDIPDYPQFRLFNLLDDPTENINLANVRLDKLNELLSRALQLKKEIVESLWRPNNMTMYLERNPNLTALGRNWCEPIKTTTLAKWN
ncbi:Arylsulfatase [Chamberlinius hualienensis]